jgi:hypothetical protein
VSQIDYEVEDNDDESEIEYDVFYNFKDIKDALKN